jgi:sterol desaturase/sphingolipid hydroxylase (fatty acid hydroxylase superfamily)
MEEITNSLSYPAVYLVTTLYFLFLYFAVGQLFLFCCKQLELRGLLVKIYDKPNANQIVEIQNSLVSIAIFGLSGVALIAMVRHGYVHLIPNSLLSVLGGLLILNVFNELHFFIIHWVLHIPFLYRNIHFVHHRSKVPSVYSVFSFHWIEALLLSTVPLVIAPFVSFSILAIFLYPLTSIMINFIGHCNYRFPEGHVLNKLAMGTKHARHHYLNSANFGFALSIFDHLFPQSKNKT